MKKLSPNYYKLGIDKNNTNPWGEYEISEPVCYLAGFSLATVIKEPGGFTFRYFEFTGESPYIKTFTIKSDLIKAMYDV